VRRVMGPWKRFATEVRDVFMGRTDTHRHLRERLVVLMSVLVVVDVIGSFAIYFLERHAPMTEITTIGDSFFWTSAQLLTVSSQLHNPITTGGRILDIFFEFLSISVVTSLAGSFGSFFVHRSEERKRESARTVTSALINRPLP
jgi:voltage-gated potassium channel